MLNYLQYLGQHFNIPVGLIITIVVFLVVANIIGEALEFKGKVVPEFMKIRKRIARKKQERETLAKMPEMMDKVKELLDDVNQHYSSDNIAMRDGWMNGVNENLKKNDDAIINIQDKLNNIEIVLYDMDVQGKRREILAFAEKIVDPNCYMSRESFDHISSVWGEYNRIIEERGIRNGVIEKSIEIIEEEFERRLREGDFIENMRGVSHTDKR